MLSSRQVIVLKRVLALLKGISGMRLPVLITCLLLSSSVLAAEPLPNDAVWRIGTGSIIDDRSYPSRCAFSNDGTLLAVGRSDGTIRVVDVSSPGRPKTLHQFRPPEP